MPDKTFISDTRSDDQYAETPAAFAVRLTPQMARELLDLMDDVKALDTKCQNSHNTVNSVRFIEFRAVTGEFFEHEPEDNDAWADISDTLYEGVWADEDLGHFGLDEDALNEDARFDCPSICVYKESVYFNAYYKNGSCKFESRTIYRGDLEDFATPKA